MVARLAEAFGLFVIVIVCGAILKMIAAVVSWIPFKMVFEIGGVAALMWLTPLGLVPAKRFVAKVTEKWKGIDT